MRESVRELLARLVAWCRRDGRDRDFDAELESHIDLAVADGLARGLDAAGARRRAIADLGGLDAAREAHRAARGLPALDALWRDLRRAARLLRRAPAFTAVAITSLALGIGANTAIFSILNSLVLRPLPVVEPSRLVQLRSGPESMGSWSYPLWVQVQSHPRLFAGSAAWGSTNLVPMAAIEGDRSEPLRVLWVSGSFFDVLGVRPAEGRLLTRTDDQAGAPLGPVAVVSSAYRQRHLDMGKPAAGVRLQLNRFAPVTVVGATPPDFLGPEVGASFDLALPLALLPQPLLDARGFSWLSVVARLKPGQTVNDALRNLRDAQPAMREATLPGGLRPDQLAEYLPVPFEAASFATGVSPLRAEYRDPLVILMSAAALVLLLACVNVANLLVARASRRDHEFRVQLALGASRGDLTRQLLIESLLLSSCGALAGLGVALWGGRLLVSELSSTVALPLPFDWRVLAFTASAAGLTGLCFGIVPALRAARGAPLSSTAIRMSAAPTRVRLAGTLIVMQVAVSLVLVGGAALLLETFTSLTSFNLGFDPAPVLAVTLNSRPGASLGQEPASGERLTHVLEVVRSIPGVDAAAFSGGVAPMSGYRQDTLFEAPHGLSLPARDRTVSLLSVGRGWFDTLGMRLLRGRDFSSEDVPVFQRVAIVNDTVARRFFPGQDPIGRVLQEIAAPGQPAAALTIVGVVNDAVYRSVRDGIPPTLYRFVPRTTSLVIRAANREPAELEPAIAAAIRQADPALLLATARPVSAEVTAGVARERVVAMLSGFFGALALLLSAVGIYGVMAHAIGERRTELAVRRALGASEAELLWLVMSRSLLLVAAGLGVGLTLGYPAMQRLQPLLYRLDAHDPRTLTAAAAVLGAVGLAAAWLPVRRALRLAPANVLREG